MAKHRFPLHSSEGTKDQITVTLSHDMNASSAIVCLKSLIHQLEKIDALTPIEFLPNKEKLVFQLCEMKLKPRRVESHEKLLLIDGSNVISKSFFATSHKGQMMQTSNGIFTNAVYTMVRKLFHLLQNHRPTHIAIMWDVSRSTFRRELYPEYKMNREEIDPALKQQFQTAQELFERMKIAQFAISGFEADDLIGTIAKQWEVNMSSPCMILSNDRDLYQLLSKNTSQILQHNGGEVIYTLSAFEEQYGIQPNQWIDVKALFGDSTDNIPGCKGVGEKAALPLVQQFGNVESMYGQLHTLTDGPHKKYIKKLEEGREMAFLSKKLATINLSVPDLNAIDLERLGIRIDKQAMFNEFERLEFWSLLSEIKAGKYRTA